MNLKIDSRFSFLIDQTVETLFECKLVNIVNIAHIAHILY